VKGKLEIGAMAIWQGAEPHTPIPHRSAIVRSRAEDSINNFEQERCGDAQL